MSLSATFDFWIVTLHLGPARTLLQPLLLPQMSWYGQDAAALATAFVAAVQNEFLAEGRYQEFLALCPPLRPEVKKLPIAISSRAVGLDCPDFTLTIPVVLSPITPRFFRGFVPSLALEAHGESAPALEQNLIQTIQLEFQRQQRFRQIRELLPPHWVEEIELQSWPVTVQLITPGEQANLARAGQSSFLARIGERLEPAGLAPAFGLAPLATRCAHLLAGRYARSVLVIGPAGSGKTALIHETLRLASDLPAVRETTAAHLIRELSAGNGWQQNLALVCRELQESGEILFIRNLAELFEVGQYQGYNVSMAEHLRLYLERGDITVLSECRSEELARIEMLSPGYTALFQPLHLPEAARAELFERIWAKSGLIFGDSGLHLTPAALNDLLILQQRYSPYSGFPGKTIRFLELARRQLPRSAGIIDSATITRLFCEESGLPPFLVDPAAPFDPPAVSQFFEKNIYGQAVALERIMNVLMALKTGLVRAGKPIASFLFVGPTGVGKTETAKVLAEYIFGERQRMIRFDMSEYADSLAVLRLIGGGGHSDGLLTGQILQQPFSLVLFDELEKADDSFFDLLLQILGEGRLTDGQGRLADFCSTIIIMTSNIGTSNFQSRPTGFGEPDDWRQHAVSHFGREVEKYFRPELFNRIEAIVPFTPLDQAAIQQIVAREICGLANRRGLKFRDVSLDVSAAARAYLAAHGFDPRYGARPLQRIIRQELLIPLAAKLNEYAVSQPLQARIDAGDPGLTIEVKGKKAADSGSALNPSLSSAAATLASNVREARREAQAVARGEYFAQLTNRVAFLKQRYPLIIPEASELARHPAHYHRLASPDKAIYHEYQALHDLQTRYNLLDGQIAELEVETMLPLLSQRGAAPELAAPFATWQADFARIKRDLYRQFQPPSAVCTLGIYGAAPFLDNIAAIYESIAAKRQWLVQKRYIGPENHRTPWFRDPHNINQLQRLLPPAKLAPLLSWLPQVDTAAEAQFIEQLRQRQFQPHELELLLSLKRGFPMFVAGSDAARKQPAESWIGLLLELSGELPYLYLQGEEDIEHIWEVGSGSRRYYVTLVNGDLLQAIIPSGQERYDRFSPERPGGRKRYYRKKFFEDTAHHIHEPSDQYETILQAVLDRAFEKRLTHILIEG